MLRKNPAYIRMYMCVCVYMVSFKLCLLFEMQSVSVGALEADTEQASSPTSPPLT